MKMDHPPLMKEQTPAHKMNNEFVMQHAAGHKHHNDFMRPHAADHKMHADHVKAMCGGGMTRK
jgi:cellobiose-specific phosphotransferase system component IIA